MYAPSGSTARQGCQSKHGRIIRRWEECISSPWFLGFLGVLLKLLGMSEMVFVITQKDQSSPDNGDEEAESNGRLTFDESPMKKESKVKGREEVVCSVLVLLCFPPFLKGLVGKGEYDIPRSTMYKSLALTLLFVLSLL
ncbi:hypothetical protein Dimus_009691 [Dionaea muscipula]